MNYLIGGMCRSGKTKLSRMLQKKSFASVYGTDELIELFGSVVPIYALDTKTDWEVKFQKTRPIILKLLELSKKHSKDIIIEGIMLKPEDIDKYLEVDPNLKIVFVGYCDISVEQKIAALTINH